MKKALKTTKAAFTIAELLIVLTVLGILAVVTIGVLWQHRPDDHVALFRKAYYATEKSLYNIVHKDEYYPHNVKKPMLLNDVQATYSGHDIEDLNGVKAVGKSKLCILFTREINVTGPAKCTATSGAQHGRAPLDINGDIGNGGNFRTADGVVWSFPIADFATDERQVVEIDVNGPKRPNCNPRTCKTGERPDRFEIIILKNGTITADGEKEREYLTASKKIL